MIGETACPATIKNGLRLREVVGDFREAPSWGSAFPGGGAGMQLFQRRVGT